MMVFGGAKALRDGKKIWTTTYEMMLKVIWDDVLPDGEIE